MHLLLKRDKEIRGHQFNGDLFVFDSNDVIFSCVTLEPAWKNNKREISCIYPGVYKCELRYSETYGHHLIIKDVKGRDLILIHFGNYRKNTKGCVLVGKNRVDIDGDGFEDVTSSVATMEELMTYVTEECFKNGFIYLTVT